MNWTNEMTVEFIELYEKHPVLWFIGHREHRNRHALARSWLEIQQEFGIDVPVDVLRRKRESIMATYRCLRRKIKKEKLEGRTFRPQWFLYNTVDRFMKKVRQSNNTDDDDPEEEDNEESEWTTLIDKDLKPLKLQETVLEVGEMEEGDEISNQSLELQFLNGKFEKNNSKRPAKPRKRFRNRKNSKIIIETDNTNSDSYVLPEQLFSQSNAAESYVSSDARRHSESFDSCSLYCQLLADKLRSLNNRNRIIVQNKIDNLIFETLMEEMGVPTHQERTLPAKEIDEDNHQTETEVSDCIPHSIDVKSNSVPVDNIEHQMETNVTSETPECE